MERLVLARLQFAFLVAVHIIFPAFNIGLSGFLTWLNYKEYRTKSFFFRRQFNLWLPIFAVSFSLGALSGFFLSLQFGHNWTTFSLKAGYIISPLLAGEVLSAFFIETSFLGIMLFGREFVTPKVFLFANFMVFLGSIFSVFWVIAAISWMHTPQGFFLDAQGVFWPLSWSEIIFNPSFGERFLHVLLACFLTALVFIGGIYTQIFKKTHNPKVMNLLKGLGYGILIISILQLIVGHGHGLKVLKFQPAKISAIEGISKSGNGVDFRILLWPDGDGDFKGISLPKISSLLLTGKLDGFVKGLDAFPLDARPTNILLIFYCFRLMVVLGLLFLLLGLGVLFYRRQDLPWWILDLWYYLRFGGFVATLCGWFVTELGRQPFLIYGFLKTKAAVNIDSLLLNTPVYLLIIAIYLIIFGRGIWEIRRFINKMVVESFYF